MTKSDLPGDDAIVETLVDRIAPWHTAEGLGCDPADLELYNSGGVRGLMREAVRESTYETLAYLREIGWTP